jgi:hypothetical protein
MYHIGDISKFDYEFNPDNFTSLLTREEAVSLDSPLKKDAIKNLLKCVMSRYEKKNS